MCHRVTPDISRVISIVPSVVYFVPWVAPRGLIPTGCHTTSAPADASPMSSKFLVIANIMAGTSTFCLFTVLAQTPNRPRHLHSHAHERFKSTPACMKPLTPHLYATAGTDSFLKIGACPGYMAREPAPRHFLTHLVTLLFTLTKTYC